MDKTIKKNLFIFSIIFYTAGIIAMVFGTINDLQITLNLFNPQNTFSRVMENFGQFVSWALWGPAFAIIFLCRRDLNESLDVIGRLIPAVKPVKNTDSKAYKVFNFIVKAITTVGFFALCVIGWKKLTENVIKNILLMADKDNLSQAVYFIMNIVIAVISILILSRVDKEKLRKIEGIALACVLFGIFIKIVEACKTITGRIRVREMIAYSNGYFNDKGLSNGRHAPLTREMIDSTDFSPFTKWYKISSESGLYNNPDSFPSGHTLHSCTTLMLFLFCTLKEKAKKAAPAALIIAFAYIAVMGFTRLVMGAHYLTDVAGAAIIGYSLFLIVYTIYERFTRKGIIGK